MTISSGPPWPGADMDAIKAAMEKRLTVYYRMTPKTEARREIQQTLIGYNTSEPPAMPLEVFVNTSRIVYEEAVPLLREIAAILSQPPAKTALDVTNSTSGIRTILDRDAPDQTRITIQLDTARLSAADAVPMVADLARRMEQNGLETHLYHEREHGFIIKDLGPGRRTDTEVSW